MKITVEGRTYRLSPTDVRTAKEAAARCIKAARAEYCEKGTLRGYVTFLIAMHVLSQDCLEQFAPEDLELILKPNKEEHWDER